MFSIVITVVFSVLISFNRALSTPYKLASIRNDTGDSVVVIVTVDDGRSVAELPRDLAPGEVDTRTYHAYLRYRIEARTADSGLFFCKVYEFDDLGLDRPIRIIRGQVQCR